MDHRSVETFRLDIGGWKGWEWFDAIYNKCKNLEQKAILIGLLKTGSRSNELNKLTKQMVDVDTYKEKGKEMILIKSQPLEKQKKAIQLVDKDGKYMYDGMRRLYRFEHIEGWRTYAFPKNEKYSKQFLKFVDQVENPKDQVFPFTYSQIYYRICTIGMELPEGVPMKDWAYHLDEGCGLFPHELRSIRACQLLRDYEYNNQKLRKFFGWAEDSPMPDHYMELTADDLIPSPERMPK
jgi:integrase